jgi:hypothetical protein
MGHTGSLYPAGMQYATLADSQPAVEQMAPFPFFQIGFDQTLYIAAGVCSKVYVRGSNYRG